MSIDYNLTYSITDEDGHRTKKDLVVRLSNESDPNLDTVFGYVARDEKALEKMTALLISIKSPAGSGKTFAELGQTPIKQMLKRQGLKQTLIARKAKKVIISLTIEIGATTNPISSTWSEVTPAPPEFLRAVRLARSGDIREVQKFLENYDYECSVS